MGVQIVQRQHGRAGVAGGNLARAQVVGDGVGNRIGQHHALPARTDRFADADRLGAVELEQREGVLLRLDRDHAAAALDEEVGGVADKRADVHHHGPLDQAAGDLGDLQVTLIPVQAAIVAAGSADRAVISETVVRRAGNLQHLERGRRGFVSHFCDRTILGSRGDCPARQRLRGRARLRPSRLRISPSPGTPGEGWGEGLCRFPP